MPPIEGEITDAGVPQTDTRSTDRNLFLSEKVSIGRLVKGKSLRAQGSLVRRWGERPFRNNEAGVAQRKATITRRFDVVFQVFQFHPEYWWLILLAGNQHS